MPSDPIDQLRSRLQRIEETVGFQQRDTEQALEQIRQLADDLAGCNQRLRALERRIDTLRADAQTEPPGPKPDGPLGPEA